MLPTTGDGRANGILPRTVQHDGNGIIKPYIYI